MSGLKKIVVNRFAQRHFQPSKPYTYYSGTASELEDEVARCWEHARPSSVDPAVMVVPISPKGMKVPYIELRQGETASVVYDFRNQAMPEEGPRMSVPFKEDVASERRIDAQHCTVICYPSELLASEKDADGNPNPFNQLEAVEGNYEIVSIQASEVMGEPMLPSTMLYNEWAGGGTPKDILEALDINMMSELQGLKALEGEDYVMAVAELQARINKAEEWVYELLRSHRMWHNKAKVKG